MNKKILISLSVIGAVAAIAIGGTVAYFSDTETSTGNTFTAGSIDLKIDNKCYFNGHECAWDDADKRYEWKTGPNAGKVCFCTWALKDLRDDVFFNFTDLKPGDRGESTISLHVYTNDAWGRMLIKEVVDKGNTCVDPEREVPFEKDGDCHGKEVGTIESDGELRENLIFWACLDQGQTPGFQNRPDQQKVDQTEGDNICQDFEPVVITPGTIDPNGETHEFWGALAAYRESLDDDDICDTTDSDGDGHANYGVCQGIARDGRLVGSTTYYLAVMWNLPYTTGNEAQSDTLQGTIQFQAVQHRNNPNKIF